MPEMFTPMQHINANRALRKMATIDQRRPLLRRQLRRGGRPRRAGGGARRRHPPPADGRPPPPPLPRPPDRPARPGRLPRRPSRAGRVRISSAPATSSPPSGWRASRAPAATGRRQQPHGRLHRRLAGGGAAGRLGRVRPRLLGGRHGGRGGVDLDGVDDDAPPAQPSETERTMPLTAHELATIALLEETDGRSEFYEGELREKPEMSVGHNQGSSRLARQLFTQVDSSEYDVRINAGHAAIPGGNSYVPDIAIVPVAMTAALGSGPGAFERVRRSAPVRRRNLVALHRPLRHRRQDSRLPSPRRRRDLAVAPLRAHPDHVAAPTGRDVYGDDGTGRHRSPPRTAGRGHRCRPTLRWLDTYGVRVTPLQTE